MKYDINIMQKNLCTMRTYLNLTQTELGDLLGVSRQQIYNIESGRTKLSKAQALAILYLITEKILPIKTEEDKWVVEQCLYRETVSLPRTFYFKD